MKVLPPASTCAICDRPLSETGGKRLVAGAICGIHRITIQATLNQFGAHAYPARLLRLTGNYRDVIIWLNGTVWTEEAASRAAMAFQRNEQPWMCQRCVGCSVCANCGTPLDRTPTWDWMSDDGSKLHSPYFMGFITMVCSQCGTEKRNMR